MSVRGHRDDAPGEHSPSVDSSKSAFLPCRNSFVSNPVIPL